MNREEYEVLARRIIEASRELVEIIERCRPLDAWPAPREQVALVHDAQDKVRDLLAELDAGLMRIRRDK